MTSSSMYYGLDADLALNFGALTVAMAKFNLRKSLFATALKYIYVLGQMASVKYAILIGRSM